MAYPVVAYDDDLLQILADYRNRADGRPTYEGSDTYTQAAVKATLAQDLRAMIDWEALQIFADTADPEFLERHALLWTNIVRKGASGASGTLRLTGTPETVFDAGLIGVDELGQEFETTEGGTIGPDGMATVEAVALGKGLSTRLALGEVVTLSSPPAGIDPEAQVPQAWTGGSDRESDAALLARHLWKLRHPEAGGNVYDYITWATAVPGVVMAWHFPLRRGLGTNDTVIIADTEDGLPGAQLIAAVQAEIDARRPAGLKDALVLGPTLFPVDISLRVRPETGYSVDAAMAARIETELADLFAGQIPDAGMALSRIETAVSLVDGVADRIIDSPLANIEPGLAPPLIGLLTLGEVTVGELS